MNLYEIQPLLWRQTIYLLNHPSSTLIFLLQRGGKNWNRSLVLGVLDHLAVKLTTLHHSGEINDVICRSCSWRNQSFFIWDHLSNNPALVHSCSSAASFINLCSFHANFTLVFQTASLPPICTRSQPHTLL